MHVMGGEKRERPSAEGVKRHADRNTHVDPDHAAFNSMSKGRHCGPNSFKSISASSNTAMDSLMQNEQPACVVRPEVAAMHDKALVMNIGKA
jgi:hypothetical protein